MSMRLRSNQRFHRVLAVIAGFLTGILLSFLLEATGCGGSPRADFSDVSILYEGEQYGDLEVIWYETAECVGVDVSRFNPVHIVIVSDLFPCNGYDFVRACMISNYVYMAEPILMQSEGALYAHELVHYFTGLEDDAHKTAEVFARCGNIRIEGFSL